MDKSISLRKKRPSRPKISGPKQISNPVPGSLNVSDQSRFDKINASSTSIGSSKAPSVAPSMAASLAPSLAPSHAASQAPSQMNGPKEKTADFVKRRYSTKVAIPPPQDMDLPALPAIPSQFSSQPPPQDSRVRNKVEVDLRALQNPNLDVEKYVATLLANATEQDIRDFQHELRGVKGRTSTGIQESVYQNRTQFIKISQEAEKLKEEMRALRTLMSDLTSTLGQTNAALGITTENRKSRKANNRSSVANLEAMWTSQLQELWRRVEGSQKFLPAVQGRHVVHESGRWVELNAATWKPKRRVHLVLLNDHLLVAAEKQHMDRSAQAQNKGAAQPQLHVERCWPLLDVQLTDFGARNTLNGAAKPYKTNASDAINVKLGSEAFTYATLQPESAEKASFLTKFRKTVNELRRSQHAEAEERGKVRSSGYFNLTVPESEALRPAQSTASFDLSPLSRANLLVDIDGRQQNFRWVEAQADELDIDVALQRYEQAVQRVERLRNVGKNNKNNALVQDLVNKRVDDRANALGIALVRQLVDTNASVIATEQFVTWLIKLGFSGRASEAYLEARSMLMQKRASQCTHQGDLQQYLYQISFIYFTIIRNTVSIYQHCFPQAMMSACVKWAKEQVDEFNAIFASQTSTMEVSDAEKRQCLDMAKEHAAALSAIGLDFRSLVGQPP